MKLYEAQVNIFGSKIFTASLRMREIQLGTSTDKQYEESDFDGDFVTYQSLVRRQGKIWKKTISKPKNYENNVTSLKKNIHRKRKQAGILVYFFFSFLFFFFWRKTCLDKASINCLVTCVKYRFIALYAHDQRKLLTPLNPFKNKGYMFCFEF